MALTVGSPAPEFKLFNTEKKEISLEDFKGKTLTILFFPLAFTSVCTVELCSIRDQIAAFQGVGSEVVGISVDSPFTLAKFKEEQNLPFDLLSDFNKTVSTNYGAIYHDFVLGMRGVSKRSAFVVNGKGIIEYAEVLDNAGELPNLTAVKECVRALAS
jgi:peroxiredoxin